MMEAYRHIESGRLRVLDPAHEDLTGWEAIDLPGDFDPQLHQWNGTAYEASLEKLKARMSAKVKARRDAQETGGLATPFGPLETDPDSQRKISGAVVMAMLGGAEFSVEWRMADNTLVTLDATGMSTLGVLVGQHVRECQARKNELDTQIAAASTVADLEDIDWGAGWPGS